MASDCRGVANATTHSAKSESYDMITMRREEGAEPARRRANPSFCAVR